MLELWSYIRDEAITVQLVTKSGGAYNDDGEWAGELTTTSQIKAVIQPATGTALNDLPEGERSTAKFFLWTQTEVALDDLVIYGGKSYRISFVWPRPDGGFCKSAVEHTK